MLATWGKVGLVSWVAGYFGLFIVLCQLGFLAKYALAVRTLLQKQAADGHVRAHKGEALGRGVVELEEEQQLLLPEGRVALLVGRLLTLGGQRELALRLRADRLERS